jgi:hypothetical protein
MDGTPTWREQYDRVKRWRARLGERTGVEDRRVDDFYAFFSTCFHLKDWLKQDNSLPESVRADVETHVNATFWLKLCADLANGSKHLELSRPRVDPKARVGTQGPAFQPGAFPANAFQTKPIVTVNADGKAWAALTVANNCVAAWEGFLQDTGLLPQ